MTARPSALSNAVKVALVLSLTQATHARVFPSQIELSDLDASDGFAVDTGVSGSFSSQSVSAAGDFNGDGIDDVIIGARGESPNNIPYAGISWLVFGSNNGFDGISPFTLPQGIKGNAFLGEGEDDRSGISVSDAGDINGDGIDDLIIGADQIFASGDPPGRAYVVFGSNSDLPAPFELSSLNGFNGFELIGEADGDQAGRTVSAAGDINGDGLDDLIVAAPYADGSVNNSGVAYVVFGSNSGFPSPFELDDINGINGFKLLGEGFTDIFGRALSSAGDVNGDGVDDLILGASGADPNGNASGRTYVVFGTNNGLPIPFPNPFPVSSLDGSNGFILNGEAINDFSGFSVGTAGDINSDGIDDIVIGAQLADSNNENAGKAYVVFGRSSGFSGEIELASINGINGFVIEGEEAFDIAGVAVAGAGDLNGDGIDDLIIGATGSAVNGDDAGRAYVVFGSDSALPSPFQLDSLDGSNGFALNGEEEQFQTGRAVDGAGDVNGDGVDDIIIGADRADTKYGDSRGRSYVVFGRPSIDLAISKTNAQSFVDPEGSVTYVIDVSNPGLVDVTGAILTDTLPPSLDSASAVWTCDLAIDTVCPNASGSGNLNEIVDLPVGASLSYSISADVLANEGEFIINTATINLPDELVDANPSNNSATDSDPTGLFADSFEDEI